MDLIFAGDGTEAEHLLLDDAAAAFAWYIGQRRFLCPHDTDLIFTGEGPEAERLLSDNIDHDNTVSGHLVQGRLQDPRDADLIFAGDGPEAERLLLDHYDHDNHDDAVAGNSVHVQGDDLAVLESERLFDLAVSEDDAKSPRGCKRARGAPDDDEGEARGAPRRASFAAVEDASFPDKLVPPPATLSDDGLWPADDDQEPVAATPLGFFLEEPQVTTALADDDPSGAGSALDSHGFLPVDPADGDGAIHHLQGGVTPDWVVEVLEDELPPPLFDDTIEFTEDYATVHLDATDQPYDMNEFTDDDFYDIVDERC
ncbi:hypothetical protein ACP70R_038840 [Stipagrostis hirtigluma subsp. patula]